MEPGQRFSGTVRFMKQQPRLLCADGAASSSAWCGEPTVQNLTMASDHRHIVQSVVLLRVRPAAELLTLAEGPVTCGRRSVSLAVEA